MSVRLAVWRVAPVTLCVPLSLLLLCVLYVVQWSPGQPSRHAPSMMAWDRRATPNQARLPACSQSQRLATLQEACATDWAPVDWGVVPEAQLRELTKFLIVDHVHRVLYCDVPKAGSTAWKNILINNSSPASGPVLPNTTRSVHGFGISKRYNVSWLWEEQDLARVRHVMATYWKFLVARHPYTRFVSAFEDKLTGHVPQYNVWITRDVLPRVRPGYQPGEELNLTFREFVQFYTQHNKYNQKFRVRDHHFKAAYRRCQPCNIMYDYIAKLETQDADMEYIVNNRLSGFRPKQTHMYSSFGSSGGASSVKLLPQYDTLSPTELKLLGWRLQKDRELFGYTTATAKNGTFVGLCGLQCC